MLYGVYAGGVLTGILITILFLVIKNRHSNQIGGTIQVDEPNNLCKFIVTSSDLQNSRTKIAIFHVEHRY